ncbi:MAG: hypothetical protein A3J74_09275 [Elusimicrobia bacterium RIFCSPHIGHO2_02_FULL_57_9]|nr:MAG: hypothetical protein A3J74_09275 [Elusimicrobia bacterium RIFCSPHIGHO2_02_FULL_57_9]
MRQKTRAVSVHLTGTELRLLQKLAFSARRSGGRKLAASVILRALIRMMQRLDVDLAGVKSAEDLKRRLLTARIKK